MDHTLLLIDGSSFIFRAYYAMPNLTSPTGEPTGAIYGVINMLKQMQKKYTTKYWGCVFDTIGKTFRDHLYPEYKAGRSETPTDLISQFENIYSIIRALGIPVIFKEGIEADDIIGSIAIAAKNNGYKVLIATSDKDFAQLVDDDITLINTMTDEKLDYNGVINKFGVAPDKIIDYLSLVGDKVDNVPGVEKCGPKTACKWLNEYGNLENIIANSSNFSGVVGENLRKAEPWLKTAKTLVTIKHDLDLSDFLPNNNFSDLIVKSVNIELLKEYYSKLGFKSWLNQLSNEAHNNIKTSVAISNKNLPQIALKTENDIKNTLDKLITKKAPIALLVIPDNFLNPTQIKFIFIATDDTIYIIDIENKQHDLFATENDSSNTLKLLISFFNCNLHKIAINYKDLISLLSKFNISINNISGDILLAHYVKNSRINHSLSAIYSEILNLEVIDIPKIHSKTTKDSIWNRNDNNSIIKECSKIIEYALFVEEQIKRQLDKKELVLYHDIELPLANILVKIENEGVLLDINKFKIIENELMSKLKDLENSIYYNAKTTFNINSPKQLQEILFKNLSIPTTGIKKNISGLFSTDEDTLAILEKQGIPIAKYLLEYRMLNKLLNTYVDKLPKMVDKNNKVHTTFEQAVVASGRLSSKDPNLQNIPNRNEFGRRIRECFIAEPNHVLICADYSQIELRILAHFSNDENLIAAFNNNLDIHSITASEIFEKPIEEISKEERRKAKIINFSLLYGKTVYGLSHELDIDRATAKIYIDTYFAKYPKIKECLEKIKNDAHNDGFVTTLWGRKIYLPNINSNNKIIREAEERLALNAPMQGTSADIIKIVMGNIDKWLSKNKLGTKIILQVHDELILHVPDSEKQSIETNLVRLMTDSITLKVKLSVNLKTAKNWDN